MQKMTKQKLVIGGIILLLTDLALAATPFTPGSQPTGWLSRPEVSHFDLSSGNEAFYQLDFRKRTWAGNVLAYDVNSTARIQTTGPWDEFDPTVATAASKLENANYDNGRKIVTLGGAFRWGNLAAAEKSALGSEKILNYVRGDRSNEEPNGLSLFPRESILGNILHSNIVYWDDGINKSLYVGANDGMLHAFDATTGEENFAYIPSMLIENLSKLTNKPIVHTYFVDGPISINEMSISGSPKTILVGGLGAGGAGLFALDISTAKAAGEAAAARQVLWEITATGDFSDLGHTYGMPVLTRLNNDKAAVIIGNGYVNNGNGHAVLYIIDAMTGELLNSIDTESGSQRSPNGLSSPTLFDMDGDAIPEYVYAGDIDGNLWKFDLSTNRSSLVFTTSPVQAITSAPVVQPHPLGGQMIAFATGRILTSGDVGEESDTKVPHYVYGIWDGAPKGNSSLVTQVLSTSSYDSVPVRSVTNNRIDWSAGNNKGWKVELPPGERVVGEKPFFNNGRFYFLSTNPTTVPAENWLHELVYNTGGSPMAPIWDLNQDDYFNSGDLAANGKIPVAKYLGSGIFSQPLLVNAYELSTTLYAFHPDLPISDGVPTNPDDPGVSGGHFDFDIYYYDDSRTIKTPTDNTQTKTICVDKKLAQNEDYDVSPTICGVNFPAGFDFLLGFTVSDQKCDGNITYIDATCSGYTTTPGNYENVKHVHEYDDKYDVTGVNMLNASVPDFNLINAIKDATTEFKVLVMNQYLNPAATISLGGVPYESVKTFGGLASITDAETLLSGLKSYSRETVDTLIYNLPLDAFTSRDWWGDGGAIRAGLMPTKTGCVNSVNDDGSMKSQNPGNGNASGRVGPQGERFDGSFTIQIIKAATPASALEFNGPDVTYGWRVTDAEFSNYVLAEYTSFWHHPNSTCYGSTNWIPDPPQDFDSNANSNPSDVGADPRDGVFGAGLESTTVVSTVGGVITTTTTYSDGSKYVKTETKNDDGSTTIKQEFRDGTVEIVDIYTGDGGEAGFVDPNTGSPEEELSTGYEGRQSWRDIVD